MTDKRDFKFELISKADIPVSATESLGTASSASHTTLIVGLSGPVPPDSHREVSHQESPQAYQRKS
jgi:hypothetical protein